MTMAENDALLAVRDLEAWYGESHILHGVAFDVREGEVVTLLGRNGVGKTTTLKAIMGIIESRTGSVRFEGKELIKRPSDVIARAGIAFCPEERGIFSTLDVKENLLLPLQVRAGGLSLEMAKGAGTRAKFLVKNLHAKRSFCVKTLRPCADVSNRKAVE